MGLMHLDHNQGTPDGPIRMRHMLCLDCHHLAEPETVLDGSDQAELATWICLVIPGLLYCAWRHFCRAKICEECGSAQLMRPSRALSLRFPAHAQPGTGAKIRSERGRNFRWPRELKTPRERLRAGSLPSAYMLAALAITSFSQSGWLRPAALEVAAGLACFALLACVWHLQPMAWQSEALARCDAWDPQGRRIRIEQS